MKALNDLLPASIRVLESVEVPSEFHARKSAKGKTNRYRILRAPICSPFLARYVWHFPYPLDEGRMASAAAKVIGEHDFTSFAAVDPERGREEFEPSNVRTIRQSCWKREGDELIYTVWGSGFLHHMVRNLVGTFVLVGKGTLQVEEIVRIPNLETARSRVRPLLPTACVWSPSNISSLRTFTRIDEIFTLRRWRAVENCESFGRSLLRARVSPAMLDISFTGFLQPATRMS